MTNKPDFIFHERTDDDIVDTNVVQFVNCFFVIPKLDFLLKTDYPKDDGVF